MPGVLLEQLRSGRREVWNKGFCAFRVGPRRFKDCLAPPPLEAGRECATLQFEGVGPELKKMLSVLHAYTSAEFHYFTRFSNSRAPPLHALRATVQEEHSAPPREREAATGSRGPTLRRRSSSPSTAEGPAAAAIAEKQVK